MSFAPSILASVIVWQALLTVGMFASAAMLIMGVFGQTGRVQVSPQREAAIAAGHTDRKTVFENPAFRPLMWLLLAMAHSLAFPRLKAWVRRTLVVAGSPNYYTAEEYLALGLLAGIMLTALGQVLTLLAGVGLHLGAAVLGMAGGLGLTLYQLWDRATRRLRTIAKRIPYSLDLIALAMGAGATFTEAVRTVTRQGGSDPLDVELRALLAEIDLGSTRRAALTNLTARVPLDSLKTIVASINQAEELGTPLAEVLHSQATLLRLQRSVRAEERAAIASVRMLVPSLLIMMAAVLAVFAPAILRAIQKGLF